MTEWHPLRSLEDESKRNASWSALNERAEKLAREIQCADMPSLDHLRMKDFEEVYEPSDDTYLLLDGLRYEADQGIFFPWTNIDGRVDNCISLILEIGCGTGVASVFLASYLRRMINNKNDTKSDGVHDNNSVSVEPTVIVTDINPRALQITQATANAAIATTPSPLRLEAIQCDLVSPLLPRLRQTIDVLIFNPPYVPTPDHEVAGQGIEASWAGGSKGRKVVDRAIPQIAQILSKPRGLGYMITVDDNEPEQIAAVFRELGLHMSPMIRRRANNEMLTVQKIQWL